MVSIWDEFRRLQNEMNRVFSRFGESDFETFERGFEDYRRPITDLSEKGDYYIIRAEIPGVNKEDIELNISDDRIEIKAETHREKEKKTKKSYSYSRNYSGFYKSFALPLNIDSSKVKAEYKNGILEIKLPKKTKKKTIVKKIRVKWLFYLFF